MNHKAVTLKVSMEGLKTKTPELKQSGQPASGAAENSSRSKSSSQFLKIWNYKKSPSVYAWNNLESYTVDKL
jgi:hypothetical protein